jgi:hypothetical protein
MHRTDTTIENSKTYFSFNADGTISGSDLTDSNNEPRCYSLTKRSNKKAWKVLCQKFDDTTSMYGAANILRQEGVRMKSYCFMD